MSLKSLENLLANASSTANWWGENRPQIKKTIRKKNTMWIAAGWAMIGVVLGVVAGVAIAWSTTTSFAPMESFEGFLWTLLVSACMAPLLVTAEMWRDKVWHKWPKHLMPPTDELKLKLFEKNVIDVQQKKAILQHIANHPNAAVQRYTDQLPALQHLELPDAWWKAVENTLKDIPTPTVDKSAQQQLDEVFVEIEYKSEQNRSPKTLKV